MMTKTFYRNRFAFTIFILLISLAVFAPLRDASAFEFVDVSKSSQDWYDEGMKYYDGNGKPQDYEKAMELFTVSAEK